MTISNAAIFGVKNSNRDFTKADTWGKNQFNSSFPAGLTNFLFSKGLENVYLFLDKQLNISHKTINTTDLYGIEPTSEDLIFSFESPYTPYQQLVIGSLPRVDLVTHQKSTGNCLRPIEIKLTALPDNSTCNLTNDMYGCELVVRPDTIVYLACSICNTFKNSRDALLQLIGHEFDDIKDWANASEVVQYISRITDAVDRIILSIIDFQEPLLMQPIWKTKGKSLMLADDCLDVFVWSNLAFIQLFINESRSETLLNTTKISRQIRTSIWLFKMLSDFAHKGRIDHKTIIDELSYNTKNDKAFAVNGTITRKYMACKELTTPRIKKEHIKNIILGGGQNFLSPERRLDAIIFSSPELFELQ